MTMSPGEMTDKRVGHFGVPVEGLKDSFQRMDGEAEHHGISLGQ